ncbi:hypothetical protein QCA50_008237 [Cerrena zonata]|uniref:Uncharacterized protein n=1 Tax=Cerrena zonata TaxID=2478898 RepID=A0AAW0GBK9_9APHY
MPYVETLLSHEALLQPIPAPPRLQEVDEIANNSCQPNHANVPRFILKPLKDEIRSEVNRLSTVLTQLYRTGIPRYQQPATYPRDREIPRIDYFCDVVIQPILDLFYSIRSSASWPPLTYTKWTYNGTYMICEPQPMLTIP